MLSVYSPQEEKLLLIAFKCKAVLIMVGFESALRS